MIPLIDLSSDQETTNRIKAAVMDVIDSKNYILGKRLGKFEEKFADFIGGVEAIGVGGGTDALRLCLRAYGIGRGDKVLTVGFTSPFTAIAILQEGAIPVFCDVSDDTLTMDVESVGGKLDSKVKAIMPVHIYGNPADMEAILKFAKKHKLVVIEDACQAVGASIGSKMVGTFGNAAAFSFYPTKNLGAMGDGGMVTAKNKTVGQMARLLRHGGQTKRFWHEYAGINSRLDEMQAAILDVKLDQLRKDNKKKDRLAKKYIEKLSHLPIKFQQVKKDAQSCWHLFVVITPLRDQLRAYLAGREIMTDVYYPYPLYSQKAFSDSPKFETPITDRLCKEVLAIPIYPTLSDSDQDYVIDEVSHFFKNL